MKKKIVINVPMHNDKANSKAMKIAVVVPGVKSVSFGEESDRLEVIGEGVDFVSLVNSLRAKFSFADIISLDDVKPAGPESSPSSPPAGSSPTPSFAQKLQPPPPHYYCKDISKTTDYFLLAQDRQPIMEENNRKEEDPQK